MGDVIIGGKQPKIQCKLNDLLRLYSKCGNFIDCAKSLKISKKSLEEIWYDVGLEKPDKNLKWKIDDENYKEIAIISDLHFGNIFQQKTCLNNFIKICDERSINTLLCAGDLTDGMTLYKDQYKECFLHSTESFEEYCKDNYPMMKKNFIISGNHDNNLAEHEPDGYDFCSNLSNIRKDISYHKNGDDKIAKPFGAPGGVKVLMYHGKKSCTNELLGQKREPKLKQKTAEILAAGMKGNIFIYGHCHRKCLTNFMGNYILGVGCFIADSPFQIERKTFGDIGGLILKYVTEKGVVKKVEPEFFSDKDLGGIKTRDF